MIEEQGTKTEATLKAGRDTAAGAIGAAVAVYLNGLIDKPVPDETAVVIGVSVALYVWRLVRETVKARLPG